jgi:rhodanese-related sulfurtransferase
MTSPESFIQRVAPSAAQQTQSDSLFLDVRTPAEYEDAHIAGAVLRPLGTWEPGEIAFLAAGKKQCVVVCQSGKRATQAAQKLQGAGFPGLVVLDGGVNAWAAAGLPLERGRKTISLERQVRIAAGTFVLTGALLGYFVNPNWIALSGFVGAGLIFAGITDTCGMGMLLAKMPWNNRGCSCGSSCSVSK